MDKRTLDKASSALKVELEKVLGPKLPGVAGYGPRLEGASHELGLTVLVDARRRKTLGASLPNSIEGLPVRVALAGSGRLD
jgi:hypothetical protein